ncbi:helix-turn-helix protein [Sinobacterium caligoides]|uniref:Helix-turn-helix protein n=1 Tax=Sinobacterium caligoides TaxID=933926 RepID=A0A3N2DJG0_9GAMM|nr:helix-turn-helix transcriptional regulator [Sinobacterium caligoides]ROR99926.1 helix-turn-helix protein [Sinobacterium caligoides]
MSIATNLTNLRKEKDLKQSELAKLANLKTEYISKIERGKMNPTAEKIKKIVIALETTADRLLFDEDEYEPEDDLKPYFTKASSLSQYQKSVVKDFLRGWISVCTSDALSGTEQTRRFDD